MRPRGQTLLELLVAVGLTVLALTMIQPLAREIDSRLTASREELEAVFLAQAKLEEVLDTPYAAIVDQDSRAAADWWSEALSAGPLPEARGQVAVAEGPVGLKTIAVAVTWRSLATRLERQASLASQKSR